MVRASPQTLISSLVETRYGRAIARIRQEIHAICLSKGLAAELHAEPDSPALKVVRRYLDSADQVFEISVSVRPADRFNFAMEMTRSRASQVETSR
jgi:DNA-binding GntR family transcriptional regulator